MKLRLSLWLVAAIVACSCRSSGPRPPPPQQVYFDSDPRGARVYLSYAAGDRAPTAREYMGQTPCTNRIVAERNGELITDNKGIIGLNKFVPVVAVVTVELGTNTRQQSIRGAAMWKDPELVPKAMFFDFNRDK